MSWLKILLQSLGLIDQPPPTAGQQPRRFELDADLHASLQHLADREDLPIEELAVDLIHQALGERQVAQAKLERWRELSPRQQDVAALICLGYTNPQIAIRLNISPETVKTHIRHMLLKLRVRSKADLRRLFEDWDFSAWW